MVNLISPKERRELTLMYVTRLLSVTFFALAAVGGIITALLVPSYLVIHADADQAAEYVRTAEQLASERAKGQSQEVMARFHESVSLLTKAARPPSLAHVLDLATQDRPSGVFLSSVDVVYADSGSASVVLEGTARTRAELIAYSNTLKKIPEFSQVTVPVSALVADVNADFAMTLTWIRPKNI